MAEGAYTRNPTDELMRMILALPISASAVYRSPANIARIANIEYAAYVVRRGPYGRTVVRRGLYYGRVKRAIAWKFSEVSRSERCETFKPQSHQALNRPVSNLDVILRKSLRASSS